MVTIAFRNRTIELRAVSFLLGKFPGKAIRRGVHELPEEAVEALKKQGIPFEIKVPSTKRRPGESPSDVVAAPKQRRKPKPGKVVKKIK